VTINTTQFTRWDIPDRLMREMRSSVFFLGAILSRAGKAVISYPGGCDIGSRPINMHLDALRQMGADIREDGGFLVCSVDGQFNGCDIHLAIPSVGVTENIMMAASRANGITRIYNAAREPEIEDLQAFINAMGGKINGAGSSTIEIEGVMKLFGAEHRIISDRIVTATFISAVAVAGGDVLLTDTRPRDVTAVVSLFSEAGCRIETEGETALRIRAEGRLKDMGHIRTAPHPGFPTDAQALVMAASCYAEGVTVFSETIFDNRYRHVCELLRMGADIRVDGRTAVVCGLPKLFGASVEATDLRGGAAMVIAALAAEGETVVNEIQHIDRGYDRLEDTLSSLGAQIKRA
jgi:UDP-N-acetylglucosamine 1-carboxyvinyltransferase